MTLNIPIACFVFGTLSCATIPQTISPISNTGLDPTAAGELGDCVANLNKSVRLISKLNATQDILSILGGTVSIAGGATAIGSAAGNLGLPTTTVSSIVSAIGGIAALISKLPGLDYTQLLALYSVQAANYQAGLSQLFLASPRSAANINQYSYIEQRFAQCVSNSPTMPPAFTN